MFWIRTTLNMAESLFSRVKKGLVQDELSSGDDQHHQGTNKASTLGQPDPRQLDHYSLRNKLGAHHSRGGVNIPKPKKTKRIGSSNSLVDSEGDVEGSKYNPTPTERVEGDNTLSILYS